MSQDTKGHSWFFEKEIVFEEGGAVSISIGYSGVTPLNVIKAMSGMGILLNEASEKAGSLKEVSK